MLILKRYKIVVAFVVIFFLVCVYVVNPFYFLQAKSIPLIVQKNSKTEFFSDDNGGIIIFESNNNTLKITNSKSNKNKLEANLSYDFSLKLGKNIYLFSVSEDSSSTSVTSYSMYKNELSSSVDYKLNISSNENVAALKGGKMFVLSNFNKQNVFSFTAGKPKITGHALKEKIKTLKNNPSGNSVYTQNLETNEIRVYDKTFNNSKSNPLSIIPHGDFEFLSDDIMLDSDFNVFCRDVKSDYDFKKLMHLDVEENCEEKCFCKDWLIFKISDKKLKIFSIANEFEPIEYECDGTIQFLTSHKEKLLIVEETENDFFLTEIPISEIENLKDRDFYDTCDKIENDVAIQSESLTTVDVSVQQESTATKDAAIQNRSTATKDAAVQNRTKSTKDVSIQKKPTPTKNAAVQNRTTSTKDVAIQKKPTPTKDAAVQNRTTSTKDVAIQKKPTPTKDAAIQNRTTSTKDVSIQKKPTPTKDAAVQNRTISTKDVAIQKKPLTTKDIAVQKTLLATKDKAVQKKTLTNDDVSTQNSKPGEKFFSSQDYDIGIKDHIIRNVDLETTISKMKKKFSFSGVDLRFVKKNKEVTSGKVGTGTKLRLIDSDNNEEDFTVVVKGDLTGSGSVNNLDVRAACQHIFRNKVLEGIEFEAADINCDGKIDTLDLLSISKIIN